MVHLPGIEGSEYATVLQVAVDAVARDSLSNDPPALERHRADQSGCVRAGAALDGIDIAAITVNDLPAVASGGAEAYSCSLQHYDSIALFQKKECRGKPGIARADYANIGFNGLVQVFTNRCGIRGGCIV